MTPSFVLAASGDAGEPWWIAAIEALIIVNLVLFTFAYLTLAERKVMGRMQLRYGPNRVGPFGLLQPIADLVKLIRKESFFPAAAVDVLYIFSPFIAAFAALTTFSVIPFGPGWEIAGYQVNGYVADVPIALILIFAIGSLGIYGFIVGGWASDSKFSLLGSMRTCAQLVSYEVSLALSVLGVVIMAKSLSLVDVVAAQESFGVWYVLPQFVGFVIFLLAGTAETARAPFDLPEAEQELVAGYHQPDHALRALRDPVPGRLALVLLGVARTALVRAQALRAALLLHLDANDAAAAALRPVDALRLEGPAPRGDAERGRHRRPGGLVVMVGSL
jgi:NADH-quinone oxidoreductase subunit H